MTDPWPLISRSLGLNNKVDQYQPDNETDLAAAMNIFISPSGFAERAAGFLTLWPEWPCHSLFCENGIDAFMVQDRAADSAIMRINPDLSLTGIWAGLVKGAKISWFQRGTKTYYTNGHQNGVIENGVRSSWPDTTEHFGAPTSRVFYPAPVGNHIAYFGGCAWVAVGPDIYVSEYQSVGKYRLAGRRFSFGTDVLMVRPVKHGVWVANMKETGFIARAEKFEAMEWIRKSTAPAHEWSDFHELADLSNTKYQVPGLSAIWSSNQGLCIGTPDGRLINTTEKRLNYPTGSSGATVVDNGIVINSVY